jgi:prepilin-type N-terminal cleavage/methylation domain-containing protein
MRARATFSASALFQRRAGVTLSEVLVAIFIMGIGLLALLTLFPLGALNMARAIQDDRSENVAKSAVALSHAGADTLSRTRDFLRDALANGSANPQSADMLRLEYVALAAEAANVEAQLRDLRAHVADPKIQRQADRLLAQIQTIKQSFDTLAWLMQWIKELAIFVPAIDG